MKTQHFNFITAQIRQRSGITLSEDKLYLIESRLQPVARQHGFESIDEMVSAMQSQQNDAVMYDIIQSMTTNETMFFRDNKPFERLTSVILPQLKQYNSGRKNIRIWSAACSTGQEPYTISLCIKQQEANYNGYQFEIVATDLCENAVAKAKSATYSQFEVQRGMPIQMLVEFFNQLDSNQWQFKDEIRKNIEFKTHNLLLSPESLGQFDIIFCRNVLIYFDDDVKRKVMNNLTSVLRPPGYLVLGSAESIIGISDNLKSIAGAPGIYTLK